MSGAKTKLNKKVENAGSVKLDAVRIPLRSDKCKLRDFGLNFIEDPAANALLNNIILVKSREENKLRIAFEDAEVVFS